MSSRYFWPASSYSYWVNTAVQLNGFWRCNLWSCSFMTTVLKSLWQGHTRCVWDTRHIQYTVGSEISWESTWLNYAPEQRFAKAKLWSFDIQLKYTIKSVTLPDSPFRVGAETLWVPSSVRANRKPLQDHSVILCTDKLDNAPPHTQSSLFYSMDLQL